MSLEHWFYKLPLRLRSLFRRDKVEGELSEDKGLRLSGPTICLFS